MSETCAECGFDWDIKPPDAIVAIRSFARRYQAPLTRFLPDEDGDAILRARPLPDTWSALEYAAHVRDVFPLYKGRVEQAQIHDNPTVEGMDPDAVAVERKYNEDDPAAVAAAIAANATALADVLDGLDLEGWGRTVVRHGEEKTCQWLAAQVVHEGSHHLLDIGRVMRAAREAAKGR